MKKMQCKQCGEKKSKSEFEKVRKVCRTCHSRNCAEDRENRAIRDITNANLIDEYIKVTEIEAAVSLYYSAESAQLRAGKVKKYKHVKFKYASPIHLVVDVVLNKPDMWKGWAKQYTIHKASGYDANTRPSIDRLDSEGHYELSNMQMLSHLDNVKKARSKPCYAYIIKDLVTQGVFKFESKQDMYRQLIAAGVPASVANIKMNTGEFQVLGNGFTLMLQSEDMDINQIKSDEPLYSVQIRKTRYIYEKETMETVEKIEFEPFKVDIGALKIIETDTGFKVIA